MDLVFGELTKWVLLTRAISLLGSLFGSPHTKLTKDGIESGKSMLSGDTILDQWIPIFKDRSGRKTILDIIRPKRCSAATKRKNDGLNERKNEFPLCQVLHISSQQSHASV
ncbi:hypothetical protein BCR41DRAFT_371437 [Lobosporangium transversale]|uniref:Uncharacterized protein n=1 Tax=Lobosporangium transversale TaxID=64571 RepID=A0A1Y2GMA2_9FUNG|nr:hypothetical protein BCR41DRAFT_371437 [Lobosporangium transversale]ORZ13931.1 hypothetical protein BCR41DRAFT_371437 [Lobosporangium transversale]|eukprot:XP_021880715.1 hypothetical protein BCR41DRAFT_371437 [Lobosporangium transversale]